MIHNPLRYQLSEYDCGPTCILNAVSVLFPREAIPPELIHHIMLYTLDNYSPEGQWGRHGTSAAAMEFISRWLTRFGEVGKLPVASRFYAGDQVSLEAGSPVRTALAQGGAVVLRVHLDVGHYILLTGQEAGRVLAFDPYFDDERFQGTPVRVVSDRPWLCNRSIPWETFAAPVPADYSLDEPKNREALVLFNTKQTEFTGG